MKFATLLPAVACLFFVAQVARGEETLESVEAQIQAKMKETKSVSGSFKSHMAMEVPGYSMKTVTEGTYKTLMADGKSCYRSESKTSSDTDIGGQKSSTKTEDLSLSNGTDMYSVSKTADGVNATHMRMPPQQPDAKPFDSVREMYALKLLPEEKVDGRNCWVIESRMKDPAMAAMGGRNVSYYCKETGFMVKMVAYGADDKPTSTTEYTNLEFNKDISADDFKWDAKLAQGATVQELGG